MDEANQTLISPMCIRQTGSILRRRHLYDLVVVGAGTAGLVVAAGAAGLEDRLKSGAGRAASHGR